MTSSALCEPLRISFLTGNEALSDTTRVLEESGVSKKTITTFQSALKTISFVVSQNDLSRFPAETNGFFTFPSFKQLAAALPKALWKLEGPFEINCFDLAIILCGTNLSAGVGPDDRSGPIIVTAAPFPEFRTATAWSCREAFQIQYPEWYRQRSAAYFDPDRIEQRICITPVLYAFRPIPFPVNERGLSSAVLGTIHRDWERFRLKTPRNPKLVLVHNVNFPGRIACTSHVGLLFKQAKGFMYLEKSGGSGPFVRLDVADGKDLVAWFAKMFEGGDRLGYTHNYMSIGADMIEIVPNSPSDDR